ncbi:class I SAM-dependent methyltransferase [Kitasatospora viridis]|uniref:class I SAM-dependent methyltransferase n=1 Tax=Kitasatospora viridis TaxID=281105 RepID=UPI0011A13281|nr:class I SAM-dependent methyltransferase [Kitasatospora viridis]
MTEVDRLFTEPVLAELYDPFCVGRADFDFYLPLLAAAGSVLDVGCGTGELLRRARAAGHRGRLCGLDPAEAMLAVARRAAPELEWHHGDLDSIDLSSGDLNSGDLEGARWDGEFELVVMTGHAFQALTGDAQLHAALAAVRRALAPGGRFVFETRNPAAREWERWTPDVVDEADGVSYWREVEQPVTGDLVSFSHTFTHPDWPHPETARSTLRFLDPPALDVFLARAGLSVEARYGDWDGSPPAAGSPEIITVAKGESDA